MGSIPPPFACQGACICRGSGGIMCFQGLSSSRQNNSCLAFWGCLHLDPKEGERPCRIVIWKCSGLWSPLRTQVTTSTNLQTGEGTRFHDSQSWPSSHHSWYWVEQKQVTASELYINWRCVSHRSVVIVLSHEFWDCLLGSKIQAEEVPTSVSTSYILPEARSHPVTLWCVIIFQMLILYSTS